MIEHRAVVQRVENGMAVVAMETSGCSSCGHGSGCGMGKLAAGRPALILKLAVGEGEVRVGDQVSVGLPESRVTVGALIGYLFPALALLFGAWAGFAFDGSDEATAVGALLAFLAAMAVARFVIGRNPKLLPPPSLLPLRAQIIPASPQAIHFQASHSSNHLTQEFPHER